MEPKRRGERQKDVSLTNAAHPKTLHCDYLRSCVTAS